MNGRAAEKPRNSDDQRGTPRLGLDLDAIEDTGGDGLGRLESRQLRQEPPHHAQLARVLRSTRGTATR